MGRWLSGLVVAALVAVAPAAAQVGAPPNNAQQNALPLPAAHGAAAGETTGATVDETDPRRPCGHSVAATLWYRLGSPPHRAVVLRLVALGQLDAVVAVYRPREGQLVALACSTSGDDGVATISFAGRSGDLVLVGQLIESRPGRFKVRTLVPQPPERAPGRPLHGTVRSTVERYLDEDDLWHVSLQAGTVYRFSLITSDDHCVYATIYSTVTKREVLSLSCDDYGLFTPGPSGGGRYLLRVTSGSSEGPVLYRLQVARAGPDDTAPGIELRRGVWTAAQLDPSGIDDIDLYRFRLERRSDVLLALARPRPSQLSLLLLTSEGLKVARGQAIRRSLRAGGYFVAVQGEAGERAAVYRLVLRVQEVSLLSVKGSRTPTLGQPVAFAVRVGSPAGRFATLQVDRFDPLEGWLFFRLYRLRVAHDNTALLAWSPPSVGRFRARITQPARSGYVYLDVMTGDQVAPKEARPQP
jgi:hypothetical protein